MLVTQCVNELAGSLLLFLLSLHVNLFYCFLCLVLNFRLLQREMFFHILHDEQAVIVFNFSLHITLAQECTNTQHQVTWVTKFCTIVRGTCFVHLCFSLPICIILWYAFVNLFKIQYMFEGCIQLWNTCGACTNLSLLLPFNKLL